MAAICTGTVHGTDRRLQGPAKSRSAPNARTCLSLEAGFRPGPTRSHGAGPRLGFSSVSVIDRLVCDNLDPLIALAAAAERTERVELLTTVLNVPFRRNAVVLAK